MRDWIFLREIRCERERLGVLVARPEETCEEIASSPVLGTRQTERRYLEARARTTVYLSLTQTHTRYILLSRLARPGSALSSCRRRRPCRPSGASSRATRQGRRRHSQIRLRSSPSSSTGPVSSETTEQTTMGPPHSKGSTTSQPNSRGQTPIASQVSSHFGSTRAVLR